MMFKSEPFGGQNKEPVLDQCPLAGVPKKSESE